MTKYLPWMPSQSARSLALATAVDKPTIRTGCSVCEEIYLGRDQDDWCEHQHAARSAVPHARNDDLKHRAALLAQQMNLVDDYESNLFNPNQRA